jgi:hypothetical protein
VPQPGPAHRPLSVESVVDKLIDASKVIQRRAAIKPSEEKRVEEAFKLLATGPPATGSKGAKQRHVYLDFMRRVQDVVGFTKVVLCAAALGPSAVAGMKDRLRVDLPYDMKVREDEFENGVLQSVADSYSAQSECYTFSSPSNRADSGSLPANTSKDGIRVSWTKCC